MYYYIYDDFVSDKKYERDLIAVENRLADLGLSGRVARLALFRNARELISDELRKGVITTVVVVGNDETLQKVIGVVSQHRVVLGLLPIGPENRLAQALGIPEGTAAVDVLSARRIETMDMGALNGEQFLAQVQFPKERLQIICDDGRYSLTSVEPSEMAIQNLGLEKDAQETDPTDGKLSAVIHVEMSRGFFRRKRLTRSVIGSHSFDVDYAEPVVVHADGREVKGAHFSVTVQPKSLRIITGKSRGL